MAKTVLVIDLEGNILTHLSADIDYLLPNDCIARPIDYLCFKDREKAYRYATMYGGTYAVDPSAVHEPFADAVEYFDNLVKNMADWNWSKAREADTATGRTYHKGPHSTKAEWRKSMKGKKR